LRLRFPIEMRKRIVKNFLDLLILKELRNHSSMSGYEIIILFRNKFRVVLSPGVVYSMLYSMERENLVQEDIRKGKRTFKLTKMGEEEIQGILGNLDKVHHLVDCTLGK